MSGVCELYAAIVEWVAATGSKDLSRQPGLWERHTEKRGAIGPLRVRLNPHSDTVDAIPPFTFVLTMDDYFPGLIGMVDPAGGMLMSSPVEGEDEAGMIAHFRAQPEHSVQKESAS